MVEAVHNAITNQGPSLSFDPVLVQRVIDLELWQREGRNPWARRYHAEAEPLYALSQTEKKERFATLALRSFEELGHVRQVVLGLEPMTRLRGSVTVLSFRMARDAFGEGADFLNRPSVAPLTEMTVGVRAERFVDGSLRPFLLCELEHLEEILDPVFSYDPAVRLPGISPNARRMVLGRLQGLWNAHAQTMLARRGLGALPTGNDAVSVQGEGLTFPDLVALACGGSGVASAGTPGSPCPLCGFPTSDWAAATDVRAAAELVSKDFPSWDETRGACGRCLESYAVAGGPAC